MLHTLNTLAATAVMERVTLLLNHVVGTEPAAVERLKGHVGRSMQLQFNGWPVLLPRLPDAAFRVTPAGLLEWCGLAPAPDADLRATVNCSNPALAMANALAGQRPKVEVAGDAAFAADLNWLFDNLRWDVQDDLARIVGVAPAREIARVAGGVASGLRGLVQTVGSAAGRRRGGAWDAPAK